VARNSTLVGVVTLAGVACVVAPAHARRADVVRVAGAWATINVCDTAAHPDGVGVRGRMPGLGDPEVTLRMRFRLQYRRGARWVSVRHADSRWVQVGSGDQRYAEAGHTFTVTPPPTGQRFAFRGTVTFQWVAQGGTPLHTERRITHSGHAGTAGADPASSSAATCAVR
jgi:hypothetical protein